MELFEEVGQTLSRTGQGLAQKARDTAQVTKLKLAVSEDERAIEGIYLSIGKAYCRMCEACSPEQLPSEATSEPIASLLTSLWERKQQSLFYIAANDQPTAVFVQLIKSVRNLLPISLDSKVGLPQSNDLFARIAVLHDQITGIAGQFIVDNAFCRCAGFNDFPNLRKIGSCVVAAVFTGDHSAFDDLGKIFPFCIIQNRGQFSGTPVFRPVGTGPAYILKTFIFRGNEMTHVLSLP